MEFESTQISMEIGEDNDMGIDLLVNNRKYSTSPPPPDVDEEFKAKPREQWMVNNDDDALSSVSSVRSTRKKSSPTKPEKVPDVVDGEDPITKGDEYWTRRPKSESEANSLKREILYEFERMRTKGVRLPRLCSMDTPLEEMQVEYMRLKKDREMDAGVMFQRQMLITCVSGIEFLSSNVSPFDCKLDGWSHHVSDRIDSYDDVLEELYRKYKGASRMAPEIKLLMALGGSAVMFSMQNRMAQMAENIMRGQPPQQSNGPQNGQQNAMPGIFSALGGMFSGLFGQQQPPSQQFPSQQFPSQQFPSQQFGQQYEAAIPMRGPTLNVDNVLKNLQQSAFERNKQNDIQRVEIISTISDSDIPDDASIMSGAFPTKSKSKRRTLDLS